MAEASLLVFICGQLAGELAQGSSGQISFRYDPDYDGIPLSFSMPVSNRTFPHRVVQPFLFGLLPDDRSIRRSIGLEFDVRSDNPFSLLENIGLDCPGAVQFCNPCETAILATRQEKLEPIDDGTIAQRLAALREHREDSWLGMHERWSLGGNQGKFALARHDGRWFACHGSAPTTHIFKNGVHGFRLQALNEFICMRLASRCGLPAANTSYEVFEGEPAIVIERYDRVKASDGRIVRLHQEDFCQILGILPENKYPEYGGPGASDIIRVISSTTQAARNARLFTSMLFFNYLIGAPDAHAKNFSLLLGTGRNALLAPLYDVASGLAYAELQRKARLAMSIGGENRVGRISRNSLKRYTQANDLSRFCLGEAACVELMAELAQTVLDNLDGAFEDAAAVPGADELREHLERPLVELCKVTLDRL